MLLLNSTMISGQEQEVQQLSDKKQKLYMEVKEYPIILKILHKEKIPKTQL